RKLVKDQIKPRLGSVTGVAAVTITGGQEREIQVLASKDRLAAVGLSITDLSRILAAENFDMPAGSIQEGLRDYRVRVLGETKSVEQIRNLRIHTPNGGNVRVSEIAQVLDTIVKPTEHARINLTDSVAVSVVKQSDANTVRVCQGVRKALEQLKSTLPSDIKFTIADDRSAEVIEAVVDLRNAIGFGAIFAALTIFLFLHNFRGTVIVALAIPTSLVATFLPIGLLGGLTLNMMVMLGLSLAVGLLVDDSVVVLENIERHLRMGELPSQAAVNGLGEIAAAAVAMTMVAVVVFLPIALMGGLMGQVFFGFAITVITCVLFSLLMSFTLTPMLASWWYRRRHRHTGVPRGMAALWNRFFQAWDRGYSAAEGVYRKILPAAVHHPYLTVMLAYGALALVTGGLFPTLKNEFFPASDTSLIGITVKMPVGTRLQQTDTVIKLIERRLSDKSKYPEVENVIATSGRVSTSVVGVGDMGPRWGGITLTLYGTRERRRKGERSADQLAVDLRRDLADIPAVDLEIAAEEGGGPGGADVDFWVFSEDAALLDQVAGNIRDTLQAKVPGLYHCKTSTDPGQPEIQLVVDRERLQDRGLSLADLAGAVRTSVEGATDSKFRQGGDEYDIRVQLERADRNSVRSIGNIYVGSTHDGQPIFVKDVAQVRLGAGPTKIEHYQRRRAVNITAYSTVLAGRDVQKAVQKVIGQMNLRRVDWEWGFGAKMQQESMSDLVRAMLLAVILIYMVAAALYNSLVDPLNILMVLPLALVGGVIGLVVFHMSMSIVAMIGFIMLMGIVSKNSILVVDYTNTLRARGMNRFEALMEAGPLRMKPVLMTTFAASLGMLPTALALSEGSEWRAPMAVVLISGLLLATAASLLVVPATYCIWDQVGNVFTRLGIRLFVRRGQTTDADEGEGE
ncbi:MAG: efflux RND transporter permease subunit, partial [Armatimonadetes bacterium]|nr:efflux RND transporter permease subunit [Armatimonadota bacterium]